MDRGELEGAVNAELEKRGLPLKLCGGVASMIQRGVDSDAALLWAELLSGNTISHMGDTMKDVTAGLGVLPLRTLRSLEEDLAKAEQAVRAAKKQVAKWRAAFDKKKGR